MYESVDSTAWDDMPAILVGTGPSLRGFDFAQLKGLGHIVAVKESYRELTFAEAVFGLDRRWMRRCEQDIEELAKRIPVYCSIPNGDAFQWTVIPGVHYIKGMRLGDGLIEDRSMVETGGNSGFGAFNLVYHHRPKDIVLFGYDYDRGSEGHYCPDRYPISNYSYLRAWGKSFSGTLPQLHAAGINVLNASLRSTVEAFNKVTHGEAIQYLDRLRSERDSRLQRGALQHVEACTAVGEAAHGSAP